MKQLLAIPDCSRSALRTGDGTIWFVRKNAVAALRDGELSFPGGGLTGNISLFSGPTGVWAFANSADGVPYTQRGPLIVRLGDSLGAQDAWEARYPNCYGLNAGWITDDECLIVGNAGIAVVSRNGEQRLVEAPHAICAGAMRLGLDEWLVTSGEVSLCALQLCDGSVRRIADLNLAGPVFELAPSAMGPGSGYLFGYYATEVGSRGAVVQFSRRGLV
jgi:hypothetical protein